jgi:hypothetical protein
MTIIKNLIQSKSLKAEGKQFTHEQLREVLQENTSALKQH